MNQNKTEARIFYKKNRWSYSSGFIKKNKLVYENLFTELNLKTKFLKGCDKNHTSI